MHLFYQTLDKYAKNGETPMLVELSYMERWDLSLHRIVLESVNISAGEPV